MHHVHWISFHHLPADRRGAEEKHVSPVKKHHVRAHIGPRPREHIACVGDMINHKARIQKRALNREGRILEGAIVIHQTRPLFCPHSRGGNHASHKKQRAQL